MSFENFTNKIAGEYPVFSINERAARVVTFYTGFNFFVGIFMAAGMQLGLRFVVFQVLSTLGFLLLFYFLTQKQFVKPIIVFSVVLLSVVYSVFWFYTGGIYGPALVSGLVIFYLVLNIVPPNWKLWSCVYIMLVIGLTLLFSYLQPDWVIPYVHNNEAYFHYAVLAIQFVGYYVFIETSNHYCFNYEQQLAQQKNNELKQANDAKLRLFAIISHDLRGPMATLKGIINSVDEGFSTPDKIQRQLTHLKSMTSPLNNTLSNLLLWSRQQLEGLNTAPEVFTIGEILQEEISLAVEDAKMHQVTIDNQVSPEVKVYADINQLRIVFRNLISNAIRYSHKNTVIELSHKIGNTEHIFSVSNTGAPIPASTVEEFNNTGKLEINRDSDYPYQRGLGLQICGDFVKVNGGKIRISTSVAGKTVFWFSLQKIQEN